MSAAGPFAVRLLPTAAAHIAMDHFALKAAEADEDFHAPNEFFRVHRLHEGLEAWARYWQILGELRV